MFTGSVPDLARSYPALYQLLTMVPTMENAEALLRPPAPAPSFSVSNIFSVPHQAPESDKVFSLAQGIRGTNNLADATGDELLIIEPAPPMTIPEPINLVLRSSPLPGYFMIHGVDPQTRLLQDEPYRQRVQAEFEQHRGDVTWLCEAIESQWSHALALYAGGTQRYAPFQERLYLRPYWEPLPAESVISELRRSQMTHHLFLLTARHELGYIYCKVEEWRERAWELHASRLNATDEMLSLADWELLRIRSRRQSHMTTVPTNSARTHARRRADKPALLVGSPSDLAQLYWDMLMWCQQVYEGTIAAPLCEDCNTRPAKPRSRRCAECARARKAEKDRQGYAERLRGLRDPTPTQARKWSQSKIRNGQK